jgi:NAD(P)-dependent dehydrogenase (short-subunit alcohol dehydrogenase family)
MTKVVLITGASSGIGKVSAEYLIGKGYKVYGTSRKPKMNKGSFPMLALDVRDKQSIDNAVQHIIEKEGKLDVLVNNAGMGITGPIEETPTEEMRQVFETNFFGAIEVMKSVLPVMRKQRNGLIINITSIAGYMGLPYRGVYSATKGALELITETLRMEVREVGVKVCNIAPGDFATNIAAGRYHAPVIEHSDYASSYQSNLDLMNAHVDEGGDPMDMARKIHEVIEKKDPSIHYKVGAFMQKFSIVLKRVLPDKAYEKLLMRHYGL